MNRFSIFKLIALALLLSAVLPSCKQAGCIDPAALNYDPEATEASDDCSYPFLSLKLMPNVDGQTFTLGETYTINGTAVRFDLFQFYVSQVGVGDMMDLETPDTYLLVKADQTDYELGQVTSGNKRMLAFNVGVDSATNHADPTAYDAENVLAPQNPTMHWNWDAGYQFIKIEGQVDTDGDGTVDGLLEMHIGKDSNLRRFMVEAHQEADAEDFVITVDYDIAKFFAGLDLSTESVTHTGDGPELATTVADNAITAFTVQK
ncbi:MAG: MbnP family protein [Bacteroidota bacterium]